MAWNPSPKVADCRFIARKWDVDQVIIIARSVKRGTLEYASYGENKMLCDEAGHMADIAYAEIEHDLDSRSLRPE